jgi:hypothetical protein
VNDTGIALISAAIAATGALCIGSAAPAFADQAGSVTNASLGSPAKIVDGGNIQSWTVSGLKQSSDAIPYQPHGTLWEATASDEAIQGGATPFVSNLNATSPGGQTYRALYQVATAQGVNPAGLSQGQKTSGKVYFDVTGDNPNTVVYRDAGGHDWATWVQPTAPQTGSGGHAVPVGSGAPTAPAPANKPATPAGNPAPAAGSSGTPIPTGSQGTPTAAGAPSPAGTPAVPGTNPASPAVNPGDAIPAAVPGAPVPAAVPGAPAPAAPGAPVPAAVPGAPAPAAPGAPAPAAVPGAPAPASSPDAPAAPAPGSPQTLPAPQGAPGSAGTPIQAPAAPAPAGPAPAAPAPAQTQPAANGSSAPAVNPAPATP